MNGQSIDPVARAVIALAAMLVAGKLAGEIAVRLKQPAVLGELLAGMVLGSIGQLVVGPGHRIASSRSLIRITSVGPTILHLAMRLKPVSGPL